MEIIRTAAELAQRLDAAGRVAFVRRWAICTRAI